MNVTEQWYPTGGRAVEIAASVETGIREGRVTPGDRLATVRDLADRLGVSPATVAAAYRDLRVRGLVRAGGRSGTTVAPRPPVLGRFRLRLPEGLVDLASGNPDPRLLPDWTEALTLVPRRSAQYGEVSVDADLMDLAATRLRADGVETAHLTLASGALDGLERVLGGHCRPGDAIAVEDPVYPTLLDLLRAMSLRPLPVRLDDRGMTPEDLERALREGARAVVLTPRSQNPFGSALNAGRRAELRALLRGQADILVVEDDHAEALGGGAVVGVAHPGLPSWAVIRSVSKTLGPDLRLAVVCGDERTVSRVEGRLGVGAGWVSNVLQRLVVGLWSLPEVDRLLAVAAATYRQRREALLTALTARGVAAHGASGYNIWVPVAAETPATAVLAEAGYCVHPGERFRLATPPAVRICCATLQPALAGSLADAVAQACHAGPARVA